jgi:hypothetical protein
MTAFETLNPNHILKKNVEELNQTMYSFLNYFIENRNTTNIKSIQSTPIYTYFVEKMGLANLYSFTQEEVQKCVIQQDSKSKKYEFIYNAKKVPFEFQTIKEDATPILLLLINMIRLYYVDHLLKIINEYFTPQRRSKKVQNYFNIVDVGTSGLTSNYNITVSGILYPQKIVESYNYYFYLFWNDYSATVFDTNIYGSSFFITLPDNFTYNNQNTFEPQSMNGSSSSSIYSRIQTKNKRKKILYLHPIEEEAQQNVFIYQIQWLLLKIQYHIHDLKIHRKFYLDLLHRVEEKIRSLLPKNQNTNNTFQKKSVILPEEFDRNIPKKIQLYEESQRAIQLKQVAYENEKTPEAQLELIESISRSNYYGFETYFCMGTIYHVVGSIQGAGDFTMTRYYYIESALENFIDIYRYYKYMVDNTKSLEYIVIKISKYVYRAYDALLHLTNKEDIKIKRDMFQYISGKMKKEYSFEKMNQNKKEQFYQLFTNQNTLSIETLITHIYNDLSLIQL